MAADNIPLSIKLVRLMYRTLGNAFPQRFGKLAYETWFSTTRFKTPDREHPALNSADYRELDVFDVPVATYIWGDNNAASGTILFIHGWSGRGTQAHAFVDPLLDAGFRVISFDGPAHGNTPGNQTSVLQLGDTLLELQNTYGPFHGVITHSFGGMVLAFAARFGFKPDRAVCICPPENLETLLGNFARVLSLPDPVVQVMIERLRMSHGNLIRTMIDTVENARVIGFPALLIHDRDDPELPWQGSERIAAAWEHAELMLTDGLKHHRILRDEQVVKAAVNYLRKP